MNHPIKSGKFYTQTYEKFCVAVKEFYGVDDAELFFSVMRKRILDKCLSDDYGWAKHESLRDWHEATILERKYKRGQYK